MLDGRRALIALLIGLALGATGFGIAIAQDEQSDDQFEAPGSEEGEMGASVEANLTPEQMVQEGAAIAERGENISRRVLAMLDEARRERDIVRVTCLNDKLRQINAHRQSVDRRRARLEEAVNTRSLDTANHHFTVLTVLGQHFRTLEQEAMQCVGDDIYETGTTRVVTDRDPATPDENLDLADPPPPEVPFIPPPFSGDL